MATLTFNQVVRRIKTMALAHKQVRTFKRGLVTDFLADKTTKYPAVFMQDNGGKISPGTHSVTYNFKLFFLDLVHVSEETLLNEQDVVSDMISVAMDMIAQMNFGSLNDWAIGIDENIQILVENDNDMNAGCVVDLAVRVQFPQNVCAAPSDFDDLDPNDTDMKLVYDDYYIATGNEGSELTTDGPGSNIQILHGKKLLLLVRAGRPLHKVDNNPISSEYEWDNNIIHLGTPANPGERFLFLWRVY